MCGIAGYIGKGNKSDLERMAEALSHRGPDDHGTWEGSGVGFAHTRLSIIDLSPAGHQPMHVPGKDITITFNGEIYNFPELRRSLVSQGVSFVGHSDTEVILRLYEREGVRCFQMMEGMFALAIFDGRTQTLILARDRAGEKPLYYSASGTGLIFASEPKALFKHPQMRKEIDPVAVSEYFAFDSIPVPKSIYAGIKKLEPATYLVFKDSKAKIERYWEPPIRSKSISFGEAVSSVDHMLERSVKAQMLSSDVPVGVFLSGGLDSSMIAYYATKASSTPVHTFSIGFEEGTYDESPFARMVSQSLGTTHHGKILSEKEVRDALPLIFSSLDEPVADATIIPNYLLSRFAREHVTVALGGEGSDELFAGYQTFSAEKFADLYAHLPEVLRKDVIEPMVRNLPVSHKYFSFDFKAKQFIRGASAPKQYRHQRWLESFDVNERALLLAEGHREAASLHDPYRRIDELLAEYPSEDAHLRVAYLYLRTYLLDIILAKVDRSSMMHALEVRAPFLDPNVMDLAFELPWEHKYARGEGKRVLRAAMKGHLPDAIIHRKKHGFALPIGDWLKGPWSSMAQETLSFDHVKAVGLCDPTYVRTLVEEHVSGAQNHRKKLWSLLALHLWHDSWMA
jgi:asparagine synthase (glutamine-hydrolysing)